MIRRWPEFAALLFVEPPFEVPPLLLGFAPPVPAPEEPVLSEGIVEYNGLTRDSALINQSQVSLFTYLEKLAVEMSLVVILTGIPLCME